VWRRGKRELDSKPGVIDPNTHDAKIDDIFKMKTSLDFDIDEYKFQSKMSILELIFADTKQPIGHVEFDLGSYTNQMKDTMKKTILDLKSEKFPGSQIYIYINIQVLEPLPERLSIAAINPRMSTIVGESAGQMIDIEANKLDVMKRELNQEIRDLDEEKIKLDQTNERLKFILTQAKAEQQTERNALLQGKIQTKKGIQKNIDKYAKQESIILKVLGIINNQASKHLFEEKDSDLVKKFEEVQKVWEVKRKQFDALKRMKDTASDFDYFAENAYF
jgi:hypothetical protein